MGTILKQPKPRWTPQPNHVFWSFFPTWIDGPVQLLVAKLAEARDETETLERTISELEATAGAFSDEFQYMIPILEFADLALRQGHIDTCDALGARARKLLAESDDHAQQHHATLLLAQVAWAHGKHDEAKDLLETLLEYSCSTPLSPHVVLTRVLQAR